MGSGPSSPSCGVFLPPPLLQAVPAPGCWVCAATPAFSSWLVRDSPPPSSVLRALCLLYYVYFLLLLLIIQYFFSFFPWVGISLSSGVCWSGQGCLWEYHVPLSSPCGPHLPKPSGHWRLEAAREPSWFLHLTCSGDVMRRLEVWRSQSFASSQWFCL
jgi:hypothetical protein